MSHSLRIACLLWAVAMLSSLARASEPVTLDNVVDPGPNSPDEPVASEFSVEKAVHFLDSASLQWQTQRKCFTCHTNYLYLYARPSVSSQSIAHHQVRAFAEQLVQDRWLEKGPRWDAEIVATAAALAFNDAATTGSLHQTTRVALDRMWDVQRPDGGWDWLNCDWPPMESDDHFGVTVAALAVGAAPGGYARTEIAQKGLSGIRSYLSNHPPPTLHHQAMVLWASTFVPDLISNNEREACIDELLSLQKEDGGWGLATMGNWERGDGQEQDLSVSDGYGTGFAIFVLRQAGVAKSSKVIQHGVHWLKTHQRESGRWFTRSLHIDNKHFITHAGTAMAIMALAACDELMDRSRRDGFASSGRCVPSVQSRRRSWSRRVLFRRFGRIR